VNPIASLGLKREKGYTSPLKTIHYPTQNHSGCIKLNESIKEAKSNVAQFVYTMHRVGKVVPPKRHILKNISLSFSLAQKSAFSV
jgi:hypothetical protein